MLETLHKDHKDLIDGAINHNKNKTDPSTKKVGVFKDYGALVLRLPDERKKAFFVTYDLWK